MSSHTESFSKPLASELERYRHQFEAIKQDAQELVAGLTDSQFNWHPGPGAWSIAQCFDHLNVTAELYIPIIREGINRGRTQQLFSEGPFRHTIFGNWFVSTVEPPVKIKVKAPKKFIPSPEKPLDKIVPAFMDIQEHFLDCLREANGIHLSKIKIQSPAVKFIRLTLGQSFALMAAHERRHLWQARQVKNHPNFPA